MRHPATPRTGRRVVAATVMLLVAAPPAGAQMFVATGRDTLRGLPGVEVAVEPLETDIEGDGLRRAAIVADVVARLRAAGITIYTSQAANQSAAKAYLYVHVNSVRMRSPAGYAVNVQVHLRQTVRALASNSNIVDAMTWDHANVIVVPVARVATLRSVITSYVDDFISDWKAVH
jgi:hypothetical protein